MVALHSDEVAPHEVEGGGRWGAPAAAAHAHTHAHHAARGTDATAAVSDIHFC